MLALLGGPAGLTAAIYAARANLQPVVIEGLQKGGQLMITSDVENYPGFPNGVLGPEVMDLFHKQAERFGTRFIWGDVTKVDLSDWPYTLYTEDEEVRAKTVVIATGASARWLGVKGEQVWPAGLGGRGVSACATCDGFFFRGKSVAVIGGGNTAVEEALYLANLAKSVTLIHRRDSLRAERILQERLFKDPKIEVVWDHAVEEICGTQNPPGVTHIRLKNTRTGALQDLPTDGVFVAIGHQPATAIFAGQLDMKPGGYLQTVPGSTATNVPGVFAAGDVADDVFRQAVTAAGLGCMAALEAERFLAAEDLVREAAE